MVAISLLAGLSLTNSFAATYPVTPAQRAEAERVAQAGVPLADLAENAPDTYTVKPHDTLWDISKLFLKTPWRWPDLWGMNKQEIANPHLIYPGQVLMLVKADGRATLQLAQDRSSGSNGVVKLSPRVRSSAVGDGAISAIPLSLIEPFLTEAVVFDTDELDKAPRVVATPEGRVLLTKGDAAYARGDFAGATDFRLFRTAVPLRDPSTQEILGYEGAYVGAAELMVPAETRKNAKGDDEIVPATLKISSVRQEAGVGDRLSPVPARDFVRYVPHAPAKDLHGQIISVYGEALNGGQNQVVALNRGSQDGLERGHVLALWKAGRVTTDQTSGHNDDITLPDTRSGLLFVFQTYKRVSYALIVKADDAINAGDRFTQP
jgi:hypothetical protein